MTGKQVSNWSVHDSCNTFIMIFYLLILFLFLAVPVMQLLQDSSQALRHR